MTYFVRIGYPTQVITHNNLPEIIMLQDIFNLKQIGIMKYNRGVEVLV